MSDLPRRVLRDLIQRYGPELSEDVPRCRGLLRDFCGQHRRECNLLVNAIEARVGHDLTKASVATPKSLLLSRLTTRMQDDFGVQESLARWAVETWALALGTITERELTSPESAPPSRPLPREGVPQQYLPPQPPQPAPPQQQQHLPPRRPAGGQGGTSGGTVRQPRSRPIPRTTPSPAATNPAATTPLPQPAPYAPMARTAGGAAVAPSRTPSRSNTRGCAGVGFGVFFLFVAAMAAAGNAFEVCIIPTIIGAVLIFWGLRKS